LRAKANWNVLDRVAHGCGWERSLRLFRLSILACVAAERTRIAKSPCSTASSPTSVCGSSVFGETSFAAGLRRDCALLYLF
jgi:hypothetical protein